MNSPSQSRHFNLRWLDRPQAWLKSLGALVPHDPKAAWSWHVTHHQLLTLAKRSNSEAGVSILWFAVAPPDQPEILLGAVLPDQRVAVVLGTRAVDLEALADFLKARLKIKSIMASQSTLRDLGFYDPELAAGRIVVERQTAWGKRLAQMQTSIGDRGNSDVVSGETYAPESKLSSRRASESDRALINRWARTFAADTDSEAAATMLEAAEWMRRGRLFIFETSTPVGMTALSGEFEDPVFGRSCRLSLIFTDPVYRGRGIGHQMLEAIEAEARLEQASGLVLFSDPLNPRVRDFYSDLGFVTSDDWLEVEVPEGVTGSNVNTTG